MSHTSRRNHPPPASHYQNVSGPRVFFDTFPLGKTCFHSVLQRAVKQTGNNKLTSVMMTTPAMVPSEGLTELTVGTK